MYRNTSKHGLSVIECVVALSVLAAMLSVVLSIQVVQSARIGLSKQKLAAEQTLSNLAQRIVAADDAELSEEMIAGWARQLEQQQGLPQPVIQVDTEVVSQPAVGRRIVLTWKAKSPYFPEYSLVAWRFKQVPGEVAEEQP
ncbi:hypothetical protein C5Y96_08920 [Blastopirellula marina]|uniref:Prepilin-type cleavage/methylation domain-containing protein n=2 Tax=Pirellulales TaxID=2691354 RepID=A0A2S8FVA2_9BACT|nr:hypothetical protein C5Y96_08920 [Blastopirellula marina]RCS53338.1 hypothetical protein DTL36_08930 [Bremerella cremea]